MNARWAAKKIARGSVAMASWMSGANRLRRSLAGTPLVRVLTYHRFGVIERDPFCVRPEDFEAQMALLKEQGRIVSLAELLAFIRGDCALPDDACLVTIDDGMESTLTHALPVLRRMLVPAVAFVSSGLVGRRIHGAEERYLDWQELRELADSGVVTIGSHAHSHRSLGLLPLSEARDEIRRSHDMIQSELGGRVLAFAYPFGTSKDFTPATDAALGEAGYSIGFNSVHGAIRAFMCPFSLPRVKVEGGESLRLFELISRGGLDAWRVVDRNLWRLQRVRREFS